MATKLYNSHLSKIIFECNEYYILDTYISLVAISSEVDSKYLIQTFTSSKAEKCYIALLLGGKKFVYKEILRDDKVISMIVQIEKDFWVNNILNRVPPKNN